MSGRERREQSCKCGRGTYLDVTVREDFGQRSCGVQGPFEGVVVEREVRERLGFMVPAEAGVERLKGGEVGG